MSYTALYRKFRPLVFEDVKGQDHIVTTLRNQIKNGRIGHAYLFCGTRGTGKTTAAKIFAKAVNCESPRDGSPCGECPMCRSIAAGTSMNVMEIDAASNTGVDNIRQIIEEVSYPPTEGKYKVYIMDEAHMLSEGARNALLKTLEEPPSYVIFILATTELHRIPITIMSRCQRYDFRRMSIDTITARMQELMEAEGYDADEKALRFVAKTADGSMRDGLSLLDKCVAFGYSEKLTYERALEILGAVDNSVYSRLMRGISASDVTGVMELIEQAVMQGRELGQFCADLLQYLRNIMLLKVSESGDMEELLNVSPEHLTLLKEDTELFSLETIFRYINVVSELTAKLKYSTQKRITLETYMIRLMKPMMDKDTLSLVQRVEELEKKLEGLSSGEIAISPANTGGDAQAQAVKEEPVKRLEAALPDDLERVVNSWNEIKGRTGHMLKGYISRVTPSVKEGGVLLLCVPDDFIAEQLKQSENRDILKELFNEYAGAEVKFEITVYDDSRSFESQYVNLLKAMNIDNIQIVD